MRSIAGRPKASWYVLADTRLGYPMGANEMIVWGWCSGFLIGNKDMIAEINQFYSRNNEIQDIWRSDRDTFVRSAEDRFAMDEGYSNATIADYLRSAQKIPG